MEWSWPESVSSNRQRVMEELIQGREIASQLRMVLDTSVDCESAEGLVSKIVGSFTNTLVILSGSKEELTSQIQPNNTNVSVAAADSSSWNTHHHLAVKSEDDSQETNSKPTSTFNDRRGCYKRRKTSHSWSRDSSTWTDDGHAWRKYGQKKIHKTNHPRNYFRCTHKFDQGCQATKHVQKIQDDPVPLFRTTYYGNHTCRHLLKAPHELILDDSTCSPIESATYIKFDDTNNNNFTTSKQEHPFFSSPIKKEFIKEEDVLPSDRVAHINQSSSSSRHYDDYFVTPHHDDLTAFDQLHHGDVICGIMMGPSYDFDDEILRSYDF